MPSFGRVSRSRLDTCHPFWPLIMDIVIKDYDCTILCGFRGATDQLEAFEAGNSEVTWPDSTHNNEFEGEPYSLGLDVAPWPYHPNDIPEFMHLAGRILTVASFFDIKVIWGGHWKSLKDYGHFELDL